MLLWLGDGNLALHLLCGTGALLACVLMAGIAPVPVLFLLWACYLSLVHRGQTFLSFPWDILLLETGFCALLVAPAAWRTTLPWKLPAIPIRDPAERRGWGVWWMREMLGPLTPALTRELVERGAE